MAEKRVTVLARLKIKKGMEEEVKRGFLSVVASTRKEPGCLSYDLHQSKDDPCLFMLYENWESQKALDDHLKGIKAHLAKTAGASAQHPDITLWEKIT